ncbi:unnamed protein product, partial [Closterium sp. NIES-65]
HLPCAPIAPCIVFLQKLEAWWMPAPTMVRWLVISNSHVLKTALRLKYPDKVCAPLPLSSQAEGFR